MGQKLTVFVPCKYNHNLLWCCSILYVWLSKGTSLTGHTDWQTSRHVLLWLCADTRSASQVSQRKKNLSAHYSIHHDAYSRIDFHCLCPHIRSDSIMWGQFVQLVLFELVDADSWCWQDVSVPHVFLTDRDTHQHVHCIHGTISYWGLTITSDVTLAVFNTVIAGAIFIDHCWPSH